MAVSLDSAANVLGEFFGIQEPARYSDFFFRIGSNGGKFSKVMALDGGGRDGQALTQQDRKSVV